MLKFKIKDTLIHHFFSTWHTKSIEDRTVIKNIFGAFTIRGGALIVSLLTMPAYMRYFKDHTALGVWFTILSVLAWILAFDLGIGNGLRNKLVFTIAQKNDEESKGLISSAYFATISAAVIVLLISFAVFPIVNWNEIFKISEIQLSRSVLLYVVNVVFSGIIIQFILKIISSILFALQKSAINNLLAFITSVLQLFFIVLMPSGTLENNLRLLSYSYIVCANLPMLIATVIVFLKYLKGFAPKLKYLKKKYIVSVFKLGGVFFWNQIMFMLIVNTNEYFISRYANPKYVVDYQIYYRLFSLLGTMLSLALTPMWSAITKAFAEGNNTWLIARYRMLKKFGVLVAVFELMIIPILQFLIDIWLKENTINVNYLYAFCFALFGGVFIYQTILSTFVCGIGNLKLQAVFYTIGIIFKYCFIKYYMLYVNSAWIVVVFSNLIILLPYCIVQQIFLNKQLKALQGNMSVEITR